MESVECEVESVECEVWSVECAGLPAKMTFQHRNLSISAMLATQNHMTTCCDTCEEKRLCSFLHRHGEARGKAETRDKTCWSLKTGILCETSSTFDALYLQN